MDMEIEMGVEMEMEMEMEIEMDMELEIVFSSWCALRGILGGRVTLMAHS